MEGNEGNQVAPKGMRMWYGTIPLRNLEGEREILKVNKRAHGIYRRIFFLDQKDYIICKYLWEEAGTKYNKVRR